MTLRSKPQTKKWLEKKWLVTGQRPFSDWSAIVLVTRWFLVKRLQALCDKNGDPEVVDRSLTSFQPPIFGGRKVVTRIGYYHMHYEQY